MATFRGWNSLDALRANSGNALYGNALAKEAKTQGSIATAPKKGEERYGFVKFGEGPSFSKPSFQRIYGQTPGAGLWSAGINPEDPQAEQKAKALLTHLLNSGNPAYQTGAWGDKTWGRDDAKMPGVRQLLAKDPNMSAKALLDYAYRAPQMQNALKPNDIGEQIGITLGEVALGVMTGGAAVPALMAAAYSGANGGNLLDVALAGLSGYGTGALGANIGSGISAAGGIGNYLSEIPGKIGGYFTDTGNYLRGAVGAGGELTNLNSGGLFPSWVEKGASAGLPGAIRGGAGLLGNVGNAGGNMGFFDSVADWAKNTLGISGGDLLRAGGDLLSGYLNTKAIKDATKAQTGAIRDAANLGNAATDKQLALLERMFNTQLGLQAPFRDAGLTAQNRMLDLLGLSNNKGAKGYGTLGRNFTMKDFQADPGYQFRLSEGLKALDQQAAARGGLISSNALRASAGYAQNMASDEYQRAYDRFNTNRTALLNPLQSLTGASQTAANTMGGAAGTYGNTAATAIGNNANNLGNLAIKAGDTRASGYLGTQNTWNSAFGNALGALTGSDDNALYTAFAKKMLGG